MASLKLRIDFDVDRALGPGKVRLLDLVGETGSISAAARIVDMSYRRAWMLVDAMNRRGKRSRNRNGQHRRNPAQASSHRTPHPPQDSVMSEKI